MLDKYVPNHKNPIIIIGDFNPCISRKRFNELPKISCKTWSYCWIKSKLKDFEFDIKVPSKGHSWVWSRSPKLFINDYIAYKDAKKVDILDLDYSWDFLNYEYYKNKGIKEDSVKAHNNCYPDHAILTAKVLTK